MWSNDGLGQPINSKASHFNKKTCDRLPGVRKHRSKEVVASMVAAQVEKTKGNADWSGIKQMSRRYIGLWRVQSIGYGFHETPCQHWWWLEVSCHPFESTERVDKNRTNALYLIQWVSFMVLSRLQILIFYIIGMKASSDSWDIVVHLFFQSDKYSMDILKHRYVQFATKIITPFVMSIHVQYACNNRHQVSLRAHMFLVNVVALLYLVFLVSYESMWRSLHAQLPELPCVASPTSSHSNKRCFQTQYWRCFGTCTHTCSTTKRFTT